MKTEWIIIHLCHVGSILLRFALKKLVRVNTNFYDNRIRDSTFMSCRKYPPNGCFRKGYLEVNRNLRYILDKIWLCLNGLNLKSALFIENVKSHGQICSKKGAIKTNKSNSQ